MLTDSTTARYALDRGYSASFAVNAIATRVRRTFTGLKLLFAHLPGAVNPADGLSRGEDVRMSAPEVSTAVQQSVVTAGMTSRVAAGNGVLSSPLIEPASRLG